MSRLLWVAVGFVAGVIIRGNVGTITHPSGGAVVLGCAVFWWVTRRAAGKAVATAVASAVAQAHAEAAATAESQAAAIAQAAVHLHLSQQPARVGVDEAQPANPIGQAAGGLLSEGAGGLVWASQSRPAATVPVHSSAQEPWPTDPSPLRLPQAVTVGDGWPGPEPDNPVPDLR